MVTEIFRKGFQEKMSVMVGFEVWTEHKSMDGTMGRRAPWVELEAVPPADRSMVLQS